jgi:shikimate dehydrogenase
MTPLRAAVLGAPIAHSLSPTLHRAAYAALGVAGRYDAVAVDEAGLPAFLDRLGPEWAGLSLTMPLKTAVLPLLHEVSAEATRVGAANTVVLSGAPGRRHRAGHNTDVPGMVATLREAGVTGVPRALVLGGGATARSAVAALAAVTSDIDICVRTSVRSAALLATGSACGVDVTVRGWDAAGGNVLDAPLVVATTPAGATDGLAGDVRRAGVVSGVLLDVVYAPWPTALAAAWSQAGGRVVGGLDLLVHQAALQVPLITGVGVPAELVPVLRRAIDQ